MQRRRTRAAVRWGAALVGVVLCCALAAGALGGVSAANQLVVDGDADGDSDYATIQGAVDDATDGDTIVVQSGTYREEVTLDSNVTLRAPNGATLNGSTVGYGPRGISLARDVSAEIEGFTIEEYGRGIDTATATSLDISDVEAVDNRIGLDVKYADSVTVRGSRVASNRHGVYVARYGPTLLENTTVERNVEEGIRATARSVPWTLRNVTVRGNRIGVHAVGSDGAWSITDSRIVDNDNGVLAHSAAGNWTVTGTAIAGNNGTGLAARNAPDGNASYNWWGSSDGPDGAYTGSGDTVSGPVSVNPIYTDRGRTALGTATARNRTPGTITVGTGPGADAAEIQTAIDRAVDGDTVAVQAGTYEETLQLGANLTLDLGPATMKGDGYDRGVIAYGRETSATIRGGTFAGDYVQNVQTGLSLRTLTVDGTTILSSNGIRSNAALTRVLNVTGDGFNRIVDGVFAEGDWIVRNTTIRVHQGAVDGSGAEGDWTITDSTIVSTDGDAISADDTTGNWTVRDTVVRDSEVGIDTAPKFSSRAPPKGDWIIDNVTVRNNTVGITAIDALGSWTVRGSSFLNNSDRAINATGATVAVDARKNWWGQPSGPEAGDCVGNVTCGAPLSGPNVTVPSPMVVPGATSPAASTDSDARFEDVNGDGRATVDDVLTYYEARGDDVIRDNPSRFDFDGDGVAGTVSDALALYEEIR